MMKKMFVLMMLLAAAVSVEAALFTVGYDAGDLGADMIIDGALSNSLLPNAGEMRDDDGDTGWAFAWDTLWNAGDTVSITGIAIAGIRSPNVADLTNNTSNGTFTFTFYEMDGSWDGTVLTTRDVTFSSEGSGPDISIYALFDTPVDFTAAGSGIAVALDSTSSLRMRNTNVLPVDGEATRIKEADGSLWGAGPGVKISLSGTPEAIPEPATMLLLGIGSLVALHRRK